MTKTTYRIGLTGGIASGKTMVADFFSDLGVAVIDTDIIARQVVEPGTAALGEIRATFGDEIIHDDGSLDRKAMREIVFADTNKREQLEAIVHPRIREETLRQMDAVGRTLYDYRRPLAGRITDVRTDGSRAGGRLQRRYPARAPALT